MSDKKEQAQRILDEIDETEWHYHWYPHVGLIPDWYRRYWDLAKMVREYILE